MLKQLKVIKEVFDRSDRIVVATDAGREAKPFIGTSTITLLPQALPAPLDLLADRPCHREGLDNLRPGSDYDNLYRAAEARAIADWEMD